MMANEILNLAAVISGLTVLIIVPFIPCAMTILHGARWPLILLTATVLGACLQALIGLLWADLAGTQPYLELTFLVIIWGTLSILCARHRRRNPLDLIYVAQEKPCLYFPLLVILAMAFIVRCLHPLEVAYLGQSDAYTHLDYLRSIVEHGHLSNPSYPSGYHWILALPTLVFSIEPYWIARFAGGFFGTGLVLGIFVLMEQMFSRRSAYLAAFAAACFPPMTLLMKTGVGSFANQFGLFLLPVIFYFYYRFINDSSRGGGIAGLLLLSLTGMAVVVPMMLLHVIIILVLHRLLELCRFSKRWFSKTAATCLVVIIPVGLILFHLSSVGPGQRLQTANTLVEYNEKKMRPAQLSEAIEQSFRADQSGNVSKVVRDLISSPYYGLVVDYFSVKRVGFGSAALNTVGGALGILFLGFSLYGLIVGRTGFLILGLWGGITLVQATLGFLQFSSYQREGWSLLIATCCLSGLIADWLLEKMPGYTVPRLGAGITMGVAVLWAFSQPPSHEPLRSDAEDLLVRSIRFLGQPALQRERFCNENTNADCLIGQKLQDDLPLTIVTRRYTGWRDQGEITPNVLQRKSPVQVMVVDDSAPDGLFAFGGQYVALIDKKVELSRSRIASAFAMVTPSMVRATLKQQQQLYKANNTILEAVAGLSQKQWTVNEIVLAENLTAIVIIPNVAGIK